jgi:putative transposase
MGAGAQTPRRAAGVRRPRALRVVPRGEGLLPQIQALKAEPPVWGDRRLWADLRFMEQLPIPKKRVLRPMREPPLPVPAHLRLNARRTPTASQPKPTRPDEWWGMDMAKVWVSGFGWVAVVVVLDGDTTKVVGDDAGLRCTAQQWLEAVDMAVNGQFPNGARGQRLALLCENGCQPTSGASLEACTTLEIRQALTSDNNPKGHADPERLMRPLKEECLWRKDWTGPLTLITALDAWLTTANAPSLHSALGYKSPGQFERDDDNSPSPPFLAA